MGARGDIQPITRQTNPGLGRQGFDPGQFDLLKKVQHLGLVAQANQIDLGARQGGSSLALASAFKALLIVNGRLCAIDEGVGARSRKVFDLDANNGIGA